MTAPKIVMDAADFRELNVTGEAIAALLGITKRHVSNLVQEGVIRKAGNGRFSPVIAVGGYIAHLKNKSAASGPQSINDLRIREMELKIAKLEKEAQVAGRDVAFLVIDEVIGKLKVEMMTIPAKVTMDLAIRDKLDAAIRDALRSAADTTAALSVASIESLEAGDAIEEDAS